MIYSCMRVYCNVYCLTFLLKIKRVTITAMFAEIAGRENCISYGFKGGGKLTRHCLKRGMLSQICFLLRFKRKLNPLFIVLTHLTFRPLHLKRIVTSAFRVILLYLKRSCVSSSRTEKKKRLFTVFLIYIAAVKKIVLSIKRGKNWD